MPTAVNLIDPLIPTGTNKWGRRTLDSLGVKFLWDPAKDGAPEEDEKSAGEDETGGIRFRLTRAERGGSEISFNLKKPKDLENSSVIGFCGGLMIVVNTIAEELGRVNDGADLTPHFRFRPNPDLPAMIRFEPAFEQLANILSTNEPLPPTPQNQTPFTTPPTQITVPPRLQHLVTSASSPILSANPQYSPGSTVSSGSNESGPEPFSDTFAFDFLRATFNSIRDELDKVAWYRRGEPQIRPMYLLRFQCPSFAWASIPLYHSPLSSNGSPKQKMTFQLGQTSVTTISDGGLSLYPNVALSYSYPVLCIQVLPPNLCYFAQQVMVPLLSFR